MQEVEKTSQPDDKPSPLETVDVIDGDTDKKYKILLMTEIASVLTLFSIDVEKVLAHIVEIQLSLHVPMNILLGLFFSVISAIFEEKAIIFIENIESDKGLLKYLIGNAPALGGFLLAGMFFVVQSYFLREAGAKYGLISFGVWSAVVVGLLLKESSANVGIKEAIPFILAMALLTYVQMSLMSK